MNLKYKRILLELNGDILADDSGFNLDIKKVFDFCSNIKELINKTGVEVSILIGGENYIKNYPRVNRFILDNIKMIGSIMNSLVVDDTFQNIGCPSLIQTSLEMNGVAELYIKEKAIKNLEKGRVVLLAGGTGNYVFSSDTAAVMKASELDIPLVIKFVNFDKKNLNNSCNAVDQTALSLSKDNNIQISIFDINEPDSLLKLVKYEDLDIISKQKIK